MIAAFPSVEVFTCSDGHIHAVITVHVGDEAHEFESSYKTVEQALKGCVEFITEWRLRND